MYKILIALLVLFPFSLISCSSDNASSSGSEKEEFCDIAILNIGAVNEKADGKYKNKNYKNNVYNDATSVDTVASYDYLSNSYVGESNNQYVACYHNNRYVLEDVIHNGDYHFSVSPGGKYFKFFRNTEEGKRLMVYSFEEKKLIDVKNIAMISGEFVKWQEDNSLIFYGINEEKRQNGIFSYSLIDGSEECIIEIENGIVEFLKKIDNEIIYCISTDEGKKLISYNIDSKEKSTLSESVSSIYDISKIDDAYFFLGELINADASLYKLQDNNIKRLVYDFPSRVQINKEMIKTKDNEILFIGKEESNSFESVYKSTKDGDISLVSDFNDEISFIK